jgi:hypothetical protein
VEQARHVQFRTVEIVCPCHPRNCATLSPLSVVPAAPFSSEGPAVFCHPPCTFLDEWMREIDINMKYASVKLLNSIRDQEGVKEGPALAYGSVETENEMGTFC